MSERIAVIRVPTDQEKREIAEKLKGTGDACIRAGKEWPKTADFEKIANVLVQNELFSVWVHDLFIVYDVAEPWYSSEPIVTECLVLRCGPRGKLADVDEFLTNTAILHGAKRVVVGTALAVSDRALCRMYGALGYRPLEECSLMKELP